MRGVNDDELVPLLEYSRRHGAELRFIEYMDVGGATRWSPEAVVSKREILAHLETHYGPIRPIGEPSSAPAERFSLPDGLTFGIIASTTEPFCASCDRARLTADGVWLMCLYASRGNRSPTAAACRGDERRTQAADLDRVAIPRRPRSRRAAGDRTTRDADTSGSPQERRTPRDAYEGGIGFQGSRGSRGSKGSKGSKVQEVQRFDEGSRFERFEVLGSRRERNPNPLEPLNP